MKKKQQNVSHEGYGSKAPNPTVGYYWWCWRFMQEKKLRFLLHVVKGTKNVQRVL